MNKYKTFLVGPALILLVAGSCQKAPPPIPELTSPTISSISPATGSAGTTVTITGTNFETLASDNTVKFNGAAATVTSASATSLVVTAPSGGSTGTVGLGSLGWGYWKNGVPAILTSTTLTSAAQAYATGVYVSGEDAYLSGYLQGSPENYWKNGTPLPLAIPDTSNEFNARSIYVAANGDVFVCGDYQYAAKYWKNGTMFNLTTTINGTSNGDESAWSIAGNGADVYMAGFYAGQGAGFWKDSVFTLPAGAQYVYGIAVK